MPGGQQSIQPWTPSVFSSDSATSYKSKIDGNSSVAGQTAGCFYVYPNTPAGMSVRIDTSFVLPNLGTGFINQLGSATTVLALTAPGVNSYIAMVYYDQDAGTCGVTYGATTAGAAPILPDALRQIPLALVTIAAGQTTIQASNILDVRGWTSLFGPYSIDAGAMATPYILNCWGATCIMLHGTFGGSVLDITLSNYRVGTPVTLAIGNSSGTTQTYRLHAITPGNVTLAVQAKTVGGSLVNLDTTAQGVAAGVNQIFSGNSISGTLWGSLI